MNNSVYTNKEIKSIIIPAFVVKNNDHILLESKDDPLFCEFSNEDEITLLDVWEDEDSIEIEFSQFFDDYDIDGWGSSFKYTMLMDKLQLNLLMGNIQIIDDK